VSRSSVPDTTALGAAYLAGLAEGVWDTLDEIAQNWRSDSQARPAPDRSGAEAGYRQWRQALSRAKAWA